MKNIKLLESCFHLADVPGATGIMLERELKPVRVLIYSHDTFGLGHLRRCRAIAHALMERFPEMNILIVSGSPVAGAFEFRAGVDFVKIPSVVKLYNGEYTSIDKHTDLQETMAIRESMIRQVANMFKPTIFIVDKEPLGLRGELEQTLTLLKSRGCHLVLGLREVMDSPRFLAAEWGRKAIIQKIGAIYNDIWVYGPPDFWDPLTDIDAPHALRSRLSFTGYLRREVPSARGRKGQKPSKESVLVTAGGGGDGAQLMHQVINAYHFDKTLTRPLIMVLGPLMSAEDREAIWQSAADHPCISIVDFDSQLETIMRRVAGVISMGGYNTFCEILSFDKRALLVPRTVPREEQFVRATRAAELGLVDMLHPDDAESPARMAAAIHRLVVRPKPSQSGYPVLLNGLDCICDLVAGIVGSLGEQGGVERQEEAG
jgi:predicted glycosyltransferase